MTGSLFLGRESGVGSRGGEAAQPVSGGCGGPGPQSGAVRTSGFAWTELRTVNTTESGL